MRVSRKCLGLLVLVLVSGCEACSPTADGKHVQTALSSPQDRSTLNQNASDASRTLKVTISYSLAKDRVTLHEPVIFNVMFANNSSEPVIVDLGANLKETFAFTIGKPNGMKVKTPQKVPEGSALLGRVPLHSGETYSEKLLLNEWFDFDAAGKYEISVRLAKPHITPKGIDVADIYNAPEFQTTLYIEPRDPTRLNEVCANLESQITNASSVAEAQEPAEALSYVTDPIAIPYLQAVINSGQMVQASAIVGLERIGGEEAIQALRTASQSKNRDAAFLATRALERLETPPVRKTSP